MIRKYNKNEFNACAQLILNCGFIHVHYDSLFPISSVSLKLNSWRKHKYHFKIFIQSFVIENNYFTVLSVANHRDSNAYFDFPLAKVSSKWIVLIDW